MSAELQWELIRNHNAFMVRRSGVTFSREPTNLVKKHSYKYSGLAQSKVISITAAPEGVRISRRSTKRPANKVATSFTKPSLIKKSASGKDRANKVSKDLHSTGYRLDLVLPAQAAVCAYLRSYKPRKSVPKKLRANKLAKLTKKD